MLSLLKSVQFETIWRFDITRVVYWHRAELVDIFWKKRRNSRESLNRWIMCGRSCLWVRREIDERAFHREFSLNRTLDPAEIQNACQYKLADGGKDEKKSYRKPEWRQEYNCGKQYQPSHNVAPTDVTPVLVSAKHFDFDDDSNTNASDRILVPMMWAMIPFWHKGDYRKHGLTTNNCRLEHMLQSKLYGAAFRKGQRCVILAEGFYEWQTTNPKATKSSERAAYYIYMPQLPDFEIENNESWKHRAGDVKLLKMAGLFDSWTSEDGDLIFSYSVITMESNEKLSWLHHRSPAILETDDQVADWLDFKRVTDTKHLLGLLRPAEELKWHQVSNVVNNARNKSTQCNKPIEEKGKVDAGTSTPGGSKPKSKLMESWLKMGKRKSEDNLKTEAEVKIAKKSEEWK